METFVVVTSARTQMVDITSKIRESVKKIGMPDGLCTVFIPHTTAAVTINENADPDVVYDMIKQVNKIVPFEDGYRHAEGNSAAHIKAGMFGSSAQIIVEDGSLMLGTWQGVYFCEFDGPRKRKVYVKVT